MTGLRERKKEQTDALLRRQQRAFAAVLDAEFAFALLEHGVHHMKEQ
ncbi:hypothetical protein [Streptomyces ardesiacus]